MQDCSNISNYAYDKILLDENTWYIIKKCWYCHRDLVIKLENLKSTRDWATLGRRVEYSTICSVCDTVNYIDDEKICSDIKKNIRNNRFCLPKLTEKSEKEYNDDLEIVNQKKERQIEIDREIREILENKTLFSITCDNCKEVNNLSTRDIIAKKNPVGFPKLVYILDKWRSKGFVESQKYAFSYKCSRCRVKNSFKIDDKFIDKIDQYLDENNIISSTAGNVVMKIIDGILIIILGTLGCIFFPLFAIIDILTIQLDPNGLGLLEHIGLRNSRK